MGVIDMQFCLDSFKDALRNGFLYPNSFSYGYIDEAKFSHFKKEIEWDMRKIRQTFNELQQRMDKSYFSKVMLAQSSALDYSTLQFPAYSMIVVEDLVDDWLAIVDSSHKEHARDHSLHQPLTAYVVAELLGYGDVQKSLFIPIGNRNLLDFCIDAIFDSDAAYILEMARKLGFPDNMLKDSKAAREFWRDVFYRTAILSALFHDMGYPWQYADKVEASLKRAVPHLHPTEKVVSSIIENYKNRMVFLPLLHYQTSLPNYSIQEKESLNEMTTAALETHGFPGAIAFLSMNDAIRNYPCSLPSAKIHEFSVEWAAMGIFMHDMEGKHKKLFPKLRINFSQDPLSSIISLADYLEEFDRPKVSFSSEQNISKMSFLSDCSSVKVNVDSTGTLNVGMKYTSETSKVIATKFKREETENYFNSSTGYLDLSSLGIKKVNYYPL